MPDTRLRVQCPRGLVAQHQLGLFGHGARNGDTLLLSAGELSREVVETVSKADHLQRRFGCHRVRRDVTDERYVFPSREARNEVVELKYESDALSSVGRQFLVVRLTQIAVSIAERPGCGTVEATDDVQERRFSAPGSSEQDHEFAVEQREVHGTKGFDSHFTHFVDLGKAPHIHNSLRGLCRGHFAGPPALFGNPAP